MTRHRHLLLAATLLLALGPQLPVTRALVRRGAGVVLVKISAVTNAEGRDAAGSCCSGADAAPGTVCPGPCYSMMKVCASQVRNDSVLMEMYNSHRAQPDPVRERDDSAQLQGRVPGSGNSEKTRLPPKLSPPNRTPVRIKPKKPPSSRPRRPPPPPPPVSKPQFPFGPLPNIFRSRSRAGLAAEDSRARGESHLETVGQPEEFTVMWRDSGAARRNTRRRGSRMLLGEGASCRYGALDTGVLFTNSLGGRQRDLLIKLPFEEAWPGVFELTLEIWHTADPDQAARHQLQAQSKKDGSKSIFESLIDTIATQLTKTVTEFESKNLEDVLGEEETTSEEEDSDGATENPEAKVDESIPENAEDTTSAPDEISERIMINDDNDEESSVEVTTPAPPRDRLILRLEKDHLIHAGDAWQLGGHTGYHAAVSYAVKVACGQDFTGPSCSTAKLCLNPKLKQHPRLVCTKEGEIVCRPGWEGATCDRAVCAAGCHPEHGFCDQPGECKCRVGWHGDTCAECDKLIGCSRHGYCDKPFECRCRPGWTGLFCTEPVCRAGCEDTRGYCTRPDTCTCRAGWQGDTCDTCVPAEGCEHGTCSQPGECSCAAGWAGRRCDQPQCGAECSPEHGTCATPGTCRCRLGWRGPGCHTCVPLPGCVNGHCKEAWQCECEAGWAGTFCDQIETEVFGSGVRDGRCQKGAAFLCMNGGVDVCSWSGNGTMVDRPRCKCPPGYSGKYCQDSLSRGEDTVFAVLPTANNSSRSDLDEVADLFPSKLDNALEKL